MIFSPNVIIIIIILIIIISIICYIFKRKFLIENFSYINPVNPGITFNYYKFIKVLLNNNTKIPTNKKVIIPFKSPNYINTYTKGWDQDNNEYIFNSGKHSYAYRLMINIGNLSNNIGKKITFYYKINDKFYKIKDYIVDKEMLFRYNIFDSDIKILPLVKKGDKLSFYIFTDGNNLNYSSFLSSFALYLPKSII
jgi:hypothetical protein